MVKVNSMPMIGASIVGLYWVNSVRGLMIIFGSGFGAIKNADVLG